MQRFTPRRPGSNWSEINIAKVAKLTEEGLMRPAGLRAFEPQEARPGCTRSSGRRRSSPESRPLRANAAAWEYWGAQRATAGRRPTG